ncbi:MAG: YCF48-related protein [Pseudomonadota bacterium]|nr:YCF48-related protein [Pseudomonadota bacterium]
MARQVITSILGLIVTVVLTTAVARAEDFKQYLDLRPAIPSQLATDSLLTDVEPAGDKLITVGERGHILVSGDQGQSWDQAQVPLQYLLTAVDFPTPELGWAVGHEGVILHTADGGATWSLQWANPHRQLSDEELSQLTDEQFMKLPQQGSPLLDVWFRDARVGFAVGAYGMFLGTTDGGESWTDIAGRIENYDGWHLNAIEAGDNGVVYIAGEKGVLFRSDDHGETWTTLAGPYQGSYFGALTGPGTDDVLLFGLQGNIFKSSDRGETWVKAKSKASDGLMDGVRLDSGGIILVGNSGVILNSDDGGLNFSMRITPSREAILAVTPLPDGKLLMVGQGGVQIDGARQR